MSFRNFYEREKHVIVHGQPRNFRIAKWLIIVIAAAFLFRYFGWQITLIAFLCCAGAGVILHFFLRWKSDGWTKSWGPYKRIKLDGE